jgi:TonB family protein
MMLHKNSSRASLLKLLALVPIVGVALAMQAETVNEYVFTEKTQNPPQKVVKKDKTNKQVKMGNKTIEVKAEQKTEATTKSATNGARDSKEEKKPEKKPNGVVSVDTPEPDEAFDVVEQMPEFPGGIGELMKYLSMNVRYPVEASKNGAQGRVLVQFIVEKDGSISEVEVVKKVNEHLDAEAVRVVNAMPKWKPGMQKGAPVRVKFTLPITFRLS